jgi:hypothetical protein
LQNFCERDRGKRAEAREQKNAIPCKKLMDKRPGGASRRVRMCWNCASCLTDSHHGRARRASVFRIKLCQLIKRLSRAAGAQSQRPADCGAARFEFAAAKPLPCPRDRAIVTG